MPPKTQSTLERSVKGNPNFKIFSGALKAYQKDDQRKYLSCTASSSVIDLHGDQMSSECVQDMAPQAKRKSMTIFLNHSYDVPEDVFGTTVDATVTQNADVWDLGLEIVLNEANQRAIETYEAIKDQGVKLGVSIGADILDYSFKDEKAGWWGGLDIKQVDLLEASIVGIPANPRSWVQNAVRAIKSFDPDAGLPADDEDLIESGKTSSAQLLDKLDELQNKTIEVKEDEPTIEIELADSATTESDTEEESEEKTEETSEAEAVEKKASEEPTSTVDLETTLEAAKADPSGMLVATLSNAFIEAMKQLDVERKRAEEAEANFQLAATIVEKIAQTPLGSKTRFAAPVNDFRTKFAGTYGEALVRLLDERNDE